MEHECSGSLRAKLLGRVLRWLPPETKGKARLARLLSGKNMRAKSILIRDREGNRIFLPNLLDSVGLHLWMDGIYERGVMAFLRSIIDPASVVVDVGANVGGFTVPLARHLNQGGKVIALEPAPKIVSVLKRNVEINRLTNVIVMGCAASTGDSSHVPFYEAPMDHFGMGSSAPQFDRAPVLVPAKSIDEILKENHVSNVSCVKVDVEGYEAHVFLGAESLLRSSPPPRLVFEFCDWAEERAFPGRRGWAQEILMMNGYKLWRLSDYLSGRRPMAIPLRDGFDSIVAIPAGV